MTGWFDGIFTAMNRMGVLLTTDGNDVFYGFKLEWGVWGWNECILGTHKCSPMEQCVDRVEYDGYDCECRKGAFRNSRGICQYDKDDECITGGAKCPSLSKCKNVGVGKDSFECECTTIHFIGWEGRQKRPKTLLLQNAGTDKQNPLCIPVNPVSPNINLKSTTNENKLYPYGIIYEFFKMHFAEHILTRESQNSEQLEHLFNRQLHLMNNVMRPDHRIWIKCAFQCQDEICTLDELRSYHDR